MNDSPQVGPVGWFIFCMSRWNRMAQWLENIGWCGYNHVVYARLVFVFISGTINTHMFAAAKCH